MGGEGEREREKAREETRRDEDGRHWTGDNDIETMEVVRRTKHLTLR